MKVLMVWFGMTLIASGCVATEPPRPDVELVEAKVLSDFDGTYVNRFDRERKRDLYLTALIWPEDETLDHASIEAVTIEALDPRRLSVKAMRRGEVVKEGVVTELSGFVPFQEIRSLGEQGSAGLAYGPDDGYFRRVGH